MPYAKDTISHFCSHIPMLAQYAVQWTNLFPIEEILGPNRDLPITRKIKSITTATFCFVGLKSGWYYWLLYSFVSLYRDFTYYQIQLSRRRPPQNIQINSSKLYVLSMWCKEGLTSNSHGNQQNCTATTRRDISCFFIEINPL